MLINLDKQATALVSNEQADIVAVEHWERSCLSDVCLPLLHVLGYIVVVQNDLGHLWFVEHYHHVHEDYTFLHLDRDAVFCGL